MDKIKGCLECGNVGNAWLGPIILLVILAIVGTVGVLLRGRAIAYYNNNAEAIKFAIQRITVQHGYKSYRPSP